VQGCSTNSTGRSCDVQNNCNGFILHVYSAYYFSCSAPAAAKWLYDTWASWATEVTELWAEHATWTVPVLQQQSEGGHGAVWLLTAGMQRALQPPSCAACRILYMNCIIIWPCKVNWRLNDTWSVNFQITKDALNYRRWPIDHVAGCIMLRFTFSA